MGMLKRRLLWMALTVLFVLTVTSCSSEKESDVEAETLSTAESESEASRTDETEAAESESDESSNDEVANLVGGTPGNIANGSFWGYQGNKLYYTDNYDLGILDLETGELEKIENAGGSSIQILGEYAYQCG